MSNTYQQSVPTRKVTMNLPISLIEQAQECLGKSSLTETVRDALREAVHRKGCEELMALRGKVKFQYSWQELRAMDGED